MFVTLSEGAPCGLDFIPSGLLKALCKRLSEEGLAEPGAVARLTKEYGGDLLSCARTAQSLRDSYMDSACDAMKRRMGDIDLVRPDQAPRIPLTPHPGVPDGSTSGRIAPPMSSATPSTVPPLAPVVVTGHATPAPACQMFPPAHAGLGPPFPHRSDTRCRTGSVHPSWEGY